MKKEEEKKVAKKDQYEKPTITKFKKLTDVVSAGSTPPAPTPK